MNLICVVFKRVNIQVKIRLNNVFACCMWLAAKNLLKIFYDSLACYSIIIDCFKQSGIFSPIWTIIGPIILCTVNNCEEMV